MKYNHLVKYNGAYYQAGTDVPAVDIQDNSEDDSDLTEETEEDIQDNSEDDSEPKTSGRGRKKTQ